MEKSTLQSWASVRVQEMVLACLRLYDLQLYTPDVLSSEIAPLFDLFRAQGFDWNHFFNSSEFPRKPVSASAAGLTTHGVNNAMAIKEAAAFWRVWQKDADKQSTHQRLDMLLTYHGQATGVFSCDEHLAGLEPNRGTELCTVVEHMYSLQEIFAVFGEAEWADALERIGLNALPATLTGDMWAHQYLQQGNEINAMHTDPHVWATDGPDATIFGLEPQSERTPTRTSLALECSQRIFHFCSVGRRFCPR